MLCAPDGMIPASDRRRANAIPPPQLRGKGDFPDRINPVPLQNGSDFRLVEKRRILRSRALGIQKRSLQMQSERTAELRILRIARRAAADLRDSVIAESQGRDQKGGDPLGKFAAGDGPDRLGGRVGEIAVVPAVKMDVEEARKKRHSGEVEDPVRFGRFLGRIIEPGDPVVADQHGLRPGFRVPV